MSHIRNRLCWNGAANVLSTSVLSGLLTVVASDTAREMLVVQDYNEYLFSSDNQQSVIYVTRSNRMYMFKVTKRNVH
jgi:hypothetical protein